MKSQGCIVFVLSLMVQACNSDYLAPAETNDDIFFLDQTVMYEGKDIIPVDGAYIIAGRSVTTSDLHLPAPTGDFAIVSISETGKVLWSIRRGDDFDDCAMIIKTAGNDGSVIITGFIRDTDDLGNEHSDIIVLRVNLSGSVQWEKTYAVPGDQVGYDIEETNDGGFVIAGSTTSGLSSSRDVLLWKFNANGDSIWTESFGYLVDDYAIDVEEQADGSLLLLGSTRQSYAGQSGYNIFLVKTNASGKGPVNRILGGTSDDMGCGLEVLSSGFIIAANISQGSSDKISVIKLGADIWGDPLFVRDYGLDTYTMARSFLHHDGKLIFAGTHKKNADNNILFLGIDEQGSLLFNREFGGSNPQYAVSVKPLSTSGYVILFNNDFNDGNITGFMKLDSKGEPHE